MSYKINHADSNLEDLGGGVRRRIFAYSEELMPVEVNFETGSIGAVHSHENIQCTVILSGRFRFNIDGEEIEVQKGDSLMFESNQKHGTVCLEKGKLIDIFTPMRKDFVK